MTVKEKKTKGTVRHAVNRKKALELIEAIRTKVMTLKHGYIADDEFNELVELIK